MRRFFVMRQSEPLEHNHASIHCCCQLGRAVVSLVVIATPIISAGGGAPVVRASRSVFRTNSHLMRLAYISYEYPPDTAFGGIATSTYNTARMMVERGHDVEVFTASPSRSGSLQEDGIAVHRVIAPSKREFVDAIVPSFSNRHLSQPFDLIEGPEHGADAEGVHAAFPHVPLVVKLRTPKVIIDQIGLSYVPWSSRIKYVIGRLMHGRRPNAYWRYDPNADRECLHARDAKLIISPSEAIRDRLIQMWKLDPRQIEVIPHPYAPSDELLAIEPESATNRVTYFGRLEARKGVLELMRAIPDVLKAVPDATFRFIGASLPHPRTREDLRTYMERNLRAHLRSIEFIDAVPYSDLPSYLAETDIYALQMVW